MRPCGCGYRAHGALLQIAVVRQTHAVRPQGESLSGEAIPPITTVNEELLHGIRVVRVGLTTCRSGPCPRGGLAVVDIARMPRSDGNVKNVYTGTSRVFTPAPAASNEGPG